MPTGIELFKSGKCPNPIPPFIGCMLCPYGHLTECHYPYTCDSDMCHHYDNYEEDD